MRPGIGTFLADEIRFLTFRATGPGPREQPRAYFALGLAFALLAGIGRYWDNPRAEWWQSAGLGSVMYVFVLSGILWFILAPLRPERGSIGNVLLFVSMTSPPAVLYAIPVEKFLAPNAADLTNAAFLAVVALWRVLLWAEFLKRVARLGPWTVVVATFLPIALIVTALAMLNLEHVVFDLMDGMQSDDASGNELAYSVVVTLTWVSILASIPLVLAYFGCIFSRRAPSRTPGNRNGPPPREGGPSVHNP